MITSIRWAIMDTALIGAPVIIPIMSWKIPTGVIIETFIIMAITAGLIQMPGMAMSVDGNCHQGRVCGTPFQYKFQGSD